MSRESETNRWVLGAELSDSEHIEKGISLRRVSPKSAFSRCRFYGNPSKEGRRKIPAKKCPDTAEYFPIYLGPICPLMSRNRIFACHVWLSISVLIPILCYPHVSETDGDYHVSAAMYALINKCTSSAAALLFQYTTERKAVSI